MNLLVALSAFTTFAFLPPRSLYVAVLYLFLIMGLRPSPETRDGSDGGEDDLITSVKRNCFASPFLLLLELNTAQSRQIYLWFSFF